MNKKRSHHKPSFENELKRARRMFVREMVKKKMGDRKHNHREEFNLSIEEIIKRINEIPMPRLGKYADEKPFMDYEDDY